MILDINKIKEADTKYLAKEVIYYKRIESTQLELKKMVYKVPNGTVVITDEQVAGIGTHGRTWYTNREKNITMSFVLFPKCNILSLDSFTTDIAKCMIESVKDIYGYNIDIKLPNDMKLNGKKIGGVLTQANTSGENINHIVIGIGFNVNEENFHKETIDIATSLKREFGKNFSREEIVKKFFEIFERYLLENTII